jgi:hypothetical protein
MSNNEEDVEATSLGMGLVVFGGELAVVGVCGT